MNCIVFEERIVITAPFLWKIKSLALITEFPGVAEVGSTLPMRNSPKKHVVMIANNIASNGEVRESLFRRDRK